MWLELYLEPGGVEVEAERGAVGVVVAVEVGHEDLVELLLGEVGRARVHHGAAVLLEHQLVQGHLPDSGKGPIEGEEEEGSNALTLMDWRPSPVLFLVLFLIFMGISWFSPVYSWIADLLKYESAQVLGQTTLHTLTS